MRVWRRIRQALCAHPHRIRERRDTPDAPQVLHYVCEACGDAVPVIDRATREQLRALRVGRVRRLRTWRSA